jgi:hypothetical protein
MPISSLPGDCSPKQARNWKRLIRSSTAAWLPSGRGDFPAAMSFFDEAAPRYQALNGPMSDLSLDRCEVLLAAGLLSDALAEADDAVRDIEQPMAGPRSRPNSS